jgi:hypothetical protein
MLNCDDFPHFEQQVIADLKNGHDEKAVRAIYDCVRPHFIRWGKNAFSRFNCDDDFFKDAFQETVIMFREAVLRTPNFKLSIPLKVFLTEVIGKRWILKWLKKEGRITYIAPEELMPYDEAVDSVLEDIINEELNEADAVVVDKAMTILKQKALQCYRLLTYIFYENRTTQEICELMPYRNPKVVAVKKYNCLEYIKRFL